MLRVRRLDRLASLFLSVRCSSMNGWASFSTQSHELDDNEMRLLILEKSMEHVKEFGWTTDAIARGAKDAGYINISMIFMKCA